MSVNYNIYSRQPHPQQQNFHIFNDNVRTYLHNADKVAVNIARPVDAFEQRQEDAAVNYYVRRPNCLRSRVTFLNFNIISFDHWGYGRRRKSDDDGRGAIFLLGAMVAMAGFYFLGLELNARNLLSEQRAKAKVFRTMVKGELAKDPEHPHIAAMKKVSDCEFNIFNRLKVQSNLRLTMLVCTAAAGILLAAGALAASSALVVGGSVFGLGALMGLMFTLGYNDKRAVIKEAEAMKVALEELKKQDKIHKSKIPAPDPGVDGARGFGSRFQPAY